ncbi:FHA domain protein (macronuclear) [Tetrahymena thermophila SB210]|uniref:FHA domain protein n=1 Tax=Tetrahymena thermophila (strain SB210) TaxID=312017 RepID=Q23KK2_TETTS|nr:FHA domain protein [Tetrahymena thermophila SB210]EAR96841.1 FHA domain protein [Tetrahymena thermophila SB210]|eukprot:XP_001017086.1 FHA domain protein [Tetrahymena thermophila SB210]
MNSMYDSDPFDWDQNQVLNFMNNMKCLKKLLDNQQNLAKYRGSDFIMNEEVQIFAFFKASTPEEKNQLREVKNQIIQKHNTYKSQNIDDFDIIQDSVQLIVTNDNDIFDSRQASKKLEYSDSLNTDIEKANEMIIKYYDLPYDPFDFDTPMQYDQAKNDYESYLRKCPLYHQYQDYKSKRSINRKIETQLILEIKRTQGQNEPGSQSVEKFAIKENQSVTLGTKYCDIILKDNAVSRKHVLIENINGVCSIRDLGSSCGTFIRIKNHQIPLKEGSIFECGFQEFQINKIQAEGDSAKVKLTIYDGIEQHKGKQFDLNIQNRFLIGRDIRCHFGSQFSDDKDLSSYHAKLSIKDNVLSIMDLDSQKGTWLRLSPQKEESPKYQIQNESEIKINPFLLIVKINQMGDVVVNQSQQYSNGMCLNCKAVKANIQANPCQHVICCKACYQKLSFKVCLRSDCNTPIKSVEPLYNV